MSWLSSLPFFNSMSFIFDFVSLSHLEVVECSTLIGN